MQSAPKYMDFLDIFTHLRWSNIKILVTEIRSWYFISNISSTPYYASTERFLGIDS